MILVFSHNFYKINSKLFSMQFFQNICEIFSKFHQNAHIHFIKSFHNISKILSTFLQYFPAIFLKFIEKLAKNYVFSKHLWKCYKISLKLFQNFRVFFRHFSEVPAWNFFIVVVIHTYLKNCKKLKLNFAKILDK